MRIMEKQYRATGLAAIALSGLMAGNVFSDGYRNPPPTAEGIAKSGVNSVFVDDASAISYNPANLSLQTNASLVAGVTMARTETSYLNPLAAAPFESDGDWNYLPNLYYAQPVGDNGWTVGLGVNTPYGQGVSWNAADFAPFVGTLPFQSPMIPYDAAIMMINFNPTVAYRINDSVSVGAGLDLVYSRLELKAMMDSAVLSLPPGALLYSDGDGDGWGFGANVGLTWNPVENQLFALTYRSQFKVDYEGDFTVHDVFGPGGDITGNLDASVQLPNIVTFGYGVQLSETVQLETMVEWLQWSLNDTQPLTAGGIPADQVNNWDDTFTFGIGGSWDAAEWLVVRGGYAFIPSPVPDETITPLLPDADRHAISFGLGFVLDSHRLDLAYTYSLYSDRAAPITGASPGTYDIDSDLIGLTYSLSF